MDDLKSAFYKYSEWAVETGGAFQFVPDAIPGELVALFGFIAEHSL